MAGMFDRAHGIDLACFYVRYRDVDVVGMSFVFCPQRVINGFRVEGLGFSLDVSIFVETRITCEHARDNVDPRADLRKCVHHAAD